MCQNTVISINYNDGLTLDKAHNKKNHNPTLPMYPTHRCNYGCLIQIVRKACVYDREQVRLVIRKQSSCSCDFLGEYALRFGSCNGLCGQQVRRIWQLTVRLFQCPQTQSVFQKKKKNTFSRQLPKKVEKVDFVDRKLTTFKL